MKTILFCNLPYAYAILKPLADHLAQEDEEYLWYVPTALMDAFPYKDMPHTAAIKNLENFRSDAIFVPGNDVPYWLRGLKVQVFHGLAGEKKGHFRIREYFDLYLTQGPYFTKKFQALAKKHHNFDVIETGWCKLDALYRVEPETLQSKASLLKTHDVKHVVLYAPTFSPSLTSAPQLQETLIKLIEEHSVLLIIKFHDKMDIELKKIYQNIENKNLIISKRKDIRELLQISDLMISDTSSVVYEFTLLDKPVITLNSHSEHVNWEDVHDATKLYQKAVDILQGKDSYIEQRQNTIALYHPYKDGQSAKRMITATRKYINEHGVPQKRALPFLRKFKMLKKYLWSK